MGELILEIDNIMYKFLTVLVWVSLNFCNGQAQTVMTEFNLPAEKINHIQALTANDKFFLLFDAINADEHEATKACYQIGTDGSSKKMVLDQIKKAVLCDISHYDSSYYFYYLSENRKFLTLQASTYNHITDKHKIFDYAIDIDGELWGMWNDGELSLIIYNRELNQLKVLQLHKFDVSYERVFDLPLDFSMDYKYMTYIPDNYLTTIEQGSAKYKLYKKEKSIIITVDQTFDESNTSNPQTVIINLNLEDGSQHVQNISSKNRGSFRSFIYKDRLYRTIVNKKKYELNVFNLADGNLIRKKEISLDSTIKASPIYLRNGKEHQISKNETLVNMMRLSNMSDPSVVVLPENDKCEATVIWGSYLDKASMGLGLGVVNARHPLLGVLTMVIGTAMWQLTEPAGENRYFYLTESHDHNLDYSKPENMPIRQTIDDHEIAMLKERKPFAYKGYFSFLDNKVGVYLENNSQKMTLIRYK